MIAIGVLMLPFNGIASDDDRSPATAALEACIKSRMPADRRKAKPDVEELLTHCQSELDAVLEDVPEQLHEQVRHDIRHDIVKQLERSRS